MSEEDIVTEQVRSRWFIDFNWYQESNRSFFALAQNCLCDKCRKQLKEGKIAADDILATIRDCCSKSPVFITDRLPILESIFRLFLANDNQPLDLDELGERLREWRGGDIHRTSAEVLSRLLSSDQCYGLRQAPD